MWEIKVSDQLETFLLSLALGAALCLFYDLFRMVRLEMKQKTIVVFFEDIFFWIVTAFVVYSFLLLRTNGEVRGYILLSALLGFILCRASLSVLLLKITKPLFWLLRKFLVILRFVKRKIGLILSWLFTQMKYLTLKSVNIGKFFKKLFTNTKKTT